MNVIYYNGSDLSDDGSALQTLLREDLPAAVVRHWREGDNNPADYAIVWRPPAALLAERTDLKAVFALGAGVDALLKLGEQLPAGVPIFRLEDAGMGEQMADYVSHAVLRYFRRFDVYEQQAVVRRWQQHPLRNKADFRVAVLGLGVLGTVVAQRLRRLGFPVSGWSRTPRQLDGVTCFAGSASLPDCLAQASVVVGMLPLTAATNGILNKAMLQHMPRGGYLINVGRGAHVNEADLLSLLQSGQLDGATLDVMQTEPLPDDHPFWQQPNLTVTPHVAALTIMADAHAQIAGKLRQLVSGEPVSGRVDRVNGY